MAILALPLAIGLYAYTLGLSDHGDHRVKAARREGWIAGLTMLGFEALVLGGVFLMVQGWT